MQTIISDGLVLSCKTWALIQGPSDTIMSHRKGEDSLDMAFHVAFFSFITPESSWEKRKKTLKQEKEKKKLHFPVSFLVHKRYSTLWLFPAQSWEELQCQAHVDGHEDIGSVDHHGHHGEEHRIEDRLLPWFQDVDACDEEILVVQPAHVFSHVLHIHASEFVLPRCWLALESMMMKTRQNTTGFMLQKCCKGVCLEHSPRFFP